MITYLNRLTTERDSLTQAATELAERAAREDRDMTDTERQSMTAWQERCSAIDTQLTEYNSQAESQRAYARLRDQLSEPPDEPKTERRTSTEIEVRSWGDLFVDSDAFRTYTGAGTSQRVTVPGVFDTRAEITSGGWAGTVPPYSFTPSVGAYGTPLMSVVGHVTVAANAVEWVRWSPNPQAAASIVAEGAAKPEAAMTATAESDTLDTYAHWKGITRQALEDIPQIRSIVEGRLRQGIMVALETAVGTALTTDTDIAAETSTTMLGAIRLAMSAVQTAGHTPNAVLLNPDDFANLDLAVMNSGLGGPTVQAAYWGMRPIGVPSLPAGTAYVGDFDSGVQVFDRGSTSLYMTDSHADYFVKNIVLILAEIRALVAVTEPASVVKASVAAGGA